MAPNINARQTTQPALDIKTTLISSTTPRKEALASSISKPARTRKQNAKSEQREKKKLRVLYEAPRHLRSLSLPSPSHHDTTPDRILLFSGYTRRLMDGGGGGGRVHPAPGWHLRGPPSGGSGTCASPGFAFDGQYQSAHEGHVHPAWMCEATTAESFTSRTTTLTLDGMGPTALNSV